jgi:peroxiredoxin family protein
MVAEQGQRLALIINTASYERVAFALGIATTAAAMGRDVSVLFGYGGVIRLKKGFTDSLGEETDGWIRERIGLLVKNGGVSPLSEYLNMLKKLGGKIYACPTAMELHDIVVGELVEEVDEVRSVTRFVREDIKDASVVYV